MNNTIKWCIDNINNYGFKISLICRPSYIIMCCGMYYAYRVKQISSFQDICFKYTSYISGSSK